MESKGHIIAYDKDGPIECEIIGAQPVGATVIGGLNFWCGPGGALLCDTAIPGLTQEVNDEDGSVQYYGGRFFVGETILPSAAKLIARALGGELIDPPHANIQPKPSPATRLLTSGAGYVN